jgi:hypothetical protein
MFINSRMATIGKYCDVPVYSGKMSWYSVIIRHIPWYSAIFRDIPPYSAIFRDIPAFRVFTTPMNYQSYRLNGDYIIRYKIDVNTDTNFVFIYLFIYILCFIA